MIPAVTVTVTVIFDNSGEKCINKRCDHSSLFLRIALPEGEEEDHQEERQREREREEEQDQQVEIQYDEDEV